MSEPIQITPSWGNDKWSDLDYYNHPNACRCHECKADREAMRGDYLRDEMIDREMEERRQP